MQNRRKIVSVFLALALAVSLLSGSCLLSAAESPETEYHPAVQVILRNCQNGSTDYCINGGEWAGLNEDKTWDINNLADGDTVTLRAVPNENQELDTTGTSYDCGSVPGTMDLDALQSPDGWSFPFTENSSHTLVIEYRKNSTEPESASSVSVEVRKFQNGSTDYCINGGEWAGLNEDKTWDINNLADGDTVTLRAVPNENQELDTTGTSYVCGGVPGTMDLAALQSPDGWSFIFTENSSHTIVIEYRQNSTEPPESQGNTDASVTYSFTGGQAQIRLNGAAVSPAQGDFTLNGYATVVSYPAEENDRTVRITLGINMFETFTALTINGVDCLSYVPKTADEVLNAIETGFLWVTVEVPRSQGEVYTIYTDCAERTGDEVFFGDYLWTYDESQKYLTDASGEIITDKNGDAVLNDSYIQNGRIELVSVRYGGKLYTAKEFSLLAKPGSALCWNEEEQDGQPIGGSAILPIGSQVTIKVIPNEGYAFATVGLNSQPIGTPDAENNITFTVAGGHFHLGADFTEQTPPDEPEEKIIDRIKLVSGPDRIEYPIGEEFEPEGIVLKVFYKDFTYAYVDNGFACYGFHADAVGTQTVTLIYREKAVTFSVRIIPRLHTHSYTVCTISDPDCTHTGLTAYTCEGCNDTFTVVTAKTPHQLTEDETGMTVCQDCGYREIRHEDFVNGSYACGYGWGDLDNDGSISSDDLTYLSVIACSSSLEDGQNACKAADVNGDGTINMKDIVRLKKILGILPGGGTGAYSDIPDIPDHLMQ